MQDLRKSFWHNMERLRVMTSQVSILSNQVNSQVNNQARRSLSLVDKILKLKMNFLNLASKNLIHLERRTSQIIDAQLHFF